VEAVPFFALAPDRRRAGTVPVAGVFYALPPGGPALSESAAGEWNCTADGDTEFFLLIAARDGSVRLDILGERFTKGDYRDGKLTGGWKEDGGEEFNCARPASEAWRDSRALAPLYFYDGKYTTDAKPGAQPHRPCVAQSRRWARARPRGCRGAVKL
jgi:hypothetical protein